jgi:hypothetical protein
VSEVPTISTAEVGGFRIDTNSGASRKDIEAALTPPQSPGDEKDDPSKAASELGKLGGKASAEKRAAEAKKAAKAEKQEAKDFKTESTDDKPEAKEAKAEDADEEPEKPEETGEKTEKPLGKPRDDPRARMLEATRKEAEAKRERDRIKADYDRLRDENEALKRGAKPAEAPVEAKPSEDKPSPEAFENYEQYLDARDDWNRKKWTEEQTRERHHQEVEQKLDEVVDKLVAAVRDSGVRENLSEDITSLKSTFALLAENHRDGTQNPETARHWMMNEFLFSPEQAPALMLHLSEHPDEFQRIAALTTPRAVSRELAKIEARLEAATTGNGSEPKDEVSKAAPPVKPVSGAPYVAESAEYKPGESFDSYFARHRRRPSATR